MLNFMYAKVYKKRRNCFIVLHDILLILIAILIQVIILHYTIVHQLINGEDHDIDF